MAPQHRSTGEAAQGASRSRETRRFEGTSLEDVLEQVRSELGPAAQIIEANKVRTGGIGGFFAKEVFEVVALASSGDDTAPVPAGDALDAEGREILQMLSGGLSGSAPAASEETPPPPEPSLSERLAGATAGRPDPAALRREAESKGFEPLQAPSLSTERPAFAEVLTTIAADAGSEVAAAVDQRLRHDPPVTASPSPESPLAEAPHADSPAGPAAADTPSSAATPGQHPAPVAGPSPAPAPSLTPVGPQARARASQAAALATGSMRREAAAPPVVARHLPQAPAAPAEDDGVVTGELVIAPSATAEPTADADVLALHRRGDSDPTTHRRTRRLLSWLQHDTLPRTTLVTALRGLPSAPSLPDTTGVVVAIVGRRAQAMRIAKAMARASGAAPADIVLASATYKGKAIATDLLIRDGGDAHRDRKGWRRRTMPTFVVVETSAVPSDTGQVWAREVIDELEPFQVIGVVDAARKNEDLAAWAGALGGVDAFAVDNVEDTTTPYAVLALEVPVAWLDGLPASPDRWADVVLPPEVAA